MTYATQSDLETRFGSRELAKLTDRIAGAVIDAGVVAQALADADAEIDGYLAVRFALPLAIIPPVLLPLACDLARHNLWGERRTDAIKGRYEEALRRLKEISRGQFDLDGAQVLSPAVDGVAVTSRSPERVFNASSLAGY